MLFKKERKDNPMTFTVLEFIPVTVFILYNTKGIIPKGSFVFVVVRNGTKVLSSLLNCENHATVIVIKLRKQRHLKLWTAAGISTKPTIRKTNHYHTPSFERKTAPKTPAVLDKNQVDPGLGGGEGRGQRTRLIRTDYVPKTAPWK